MTDPRFCSQTGNTKSEKRFTDAPPITAINEIVDINGTTYVFGMTNVNWYEAYVACSGLNMQMLTLDSRAKSDFWSAWLRDNPDYDVWSWTSGIRDYGLSSEWIWNTTGLEFDPSETAWAAGIALAVPRDAGTDPRNMAIINGTQYWIGHEITLAWFDAMEACNALSMALVSFETGNENTEVKNYLTANGHDGKKFWTSGYRTQQGWFWSGSGQIMTGFDWAPGQPSNAGPQLIVDSAQGWSDEDSRVQNYMICE
ncbi:hypothetical protein B566_EDAN010908 [Ephemera danica]|nr:hypothetical protein B566_EDAN010908 [Ephemera danica]